MKRNIILFKGALEVLDYFTDECADAFKKLGADVFVEAASKKYRVFCLYRFCLIMGQRCIELS